MRLHLTSSRLWRWWWPFGLVILLVMVGIGFVTKWGVGWWAAAAVVAAVYLGAPVMAGTLRELTAKPEDLLDVTTDRHEDSGAELSERSTQAMEPTVVSSRQESKVDLVPGGNPQQHTTVPAIQSSWNGRPTGPRPWRKVGSPQFAELVYALSDALTTVDQADDTAVLAGVRRHLIRGGRDNALQRWLTVLELAIDDGVDDRLVKEALKQSNAMRLREAAAAWFGSVG
jgi:hypothetical protein